MEDRTSDTEETFGSQQPPGSVSSQNTEEAEPEHGGGSAPNREGDRRSTDDPGSAKESGQSTGHPENAG